MDLNQRLPFDPKLKYKVRDPFWTILFLLYVAGMIFISYCCLSLDNVNRLMHRTDSDGNYCGVLNHKSDGSAVDLRKYPFLFFTDKTNLKKSLRVCVAKCPISYNELICPYVKNASLFQGCVTTYPTSPVFKRCVPLDIFNKKAAALVGPFFFDNRSSPQEFSQSIVEQWQLILYSVFLATLFACVWLFFLPFISTLIVWISVWFAAIFSAFGTAYFWLQYIQLVSDKQFSFLTKYNFFLENEEVLLFLALLMSVIFICMLFFLKSSYSRMDLSIQLIDETCNLLNQVQLVFFVPVFNYLLVAVFFLYSLLITLLLMYSKKEVYITAAQIISEYVYPVSAPAGKDFLNFFLYFYLFGTLWVWNVIDIACDSIIGGVIAEWYWTPAAVKEKKAVPTLSLLLRSIRRTFYYSFGSIVLGAFFSSVLSALRTVLEFIKRKLSGVQYRILRLLLTLVQFILFWIEKVVAYMNRSSCIYMAMYNRSYSDSVCAVGGLLTRNAFRSIILGWLTFIVLFVAKISISLAAVAYASYALLIEIPTDVHSGLLLVKSSHFSIILVILALAFIIASVFVSVMEISIQTLFICFLEDCERNNGTKAKPYLMPVGLHRFIEEEGPKV